MIKRETEEEEPGERIARKAICHASSRIMDGLSLYQGPNGVDENGVANVQSHRVTVRLICPIPSLPPSFSELQWLSRANTIERDRIADR